MTDLDEPIPVKRYAVSRFDDTAERRYVAVDELPEWRARGLAFLVRGRETGDDITRTLLA
jgi:polyhydroxyalkanoate synthesis regulator protein